MTTLIKALADCLAAHNVRDIYTIPGDFILSMLTALAEDRRFELLVTADEAGAAFAADGCARMGGIGCVCVTHNVGGLKVANAVAGAWAEYSPIVILSGGPGAGECAGPNAIHHLVDGPRTQMEIFSHFTAASIILDDPLGVGSELNRAFAALTNTRRPIYIEVPRHLVYSEIGPPPLSTRVDEQVTGDHIGALQQVADLLRQAHRPVVVAGLDLLRYDLMDDLDRFLRVNSLPVVVSMLARGVVDEASDYFAGIYTGDASEERVCSLIAEADVILALGHLPTDIEMGFSAGLPQDRTLLHHGSKVTLPNGTRFTVSCRTWLREILDLAFPERTGYPPGSLRTQPIVTPTWPDQTLTTDHVVTVINTHLDQSHFVIADVGDSLFAFLDLQPAGRKSAWCSPYYASMGYAIPWALGMARADATGRRPVILVGDRAFLMGANEWGTLCQNGVAPILVILDNQGFATTRLLAAGNFNDGPACDFLALAASFSNSTQLLAQQVVNGCELEAAIAAAFGHDGPAIVHAHLTPGSLSTPIQRMLNNLRNRMVTTKETMLTT